MSVFYVIVHFLYRLYSMPTGMAWNRTMFCDMWPNLWTKYATYFYSVWIFAHIIYIRVLHNDTARLYFKWINFCYLSSIFQQFCNTCFISSMLHYSKSYWVHLDDSSWSKVDMLIITIILYTKPVKNQNGTWIHRKLDFIVRCDDSYKKNDVEINRLQVSQFSPSHVFSTLPSTAYSHPGIYNIY